MGAVTQPPPPSPWRALFWEPVSGTGERLMVGVVYQFGGQWDATRILRDDVLAALYGKAAEGARRLIDTALDMYRAAARAGDSLDNLGAAIGGLHPSELRRTQTLSVPELLRIAALQYSSLANMDSLDDADDADAPAGEEITRRFSADVRAHVSSRRPDLANYFGRTAVLVTGGDSVRFGYASTMLLAHFNVLSPVRHGSSMRDARGRLWELERGQRIGRQPRVALVSAVPRADDPMLGDRQHNKTREMIHELAREADTAGVIFKTVHSAESAADEVIEMEAA